MNLKDCCLSAALWGTGLAPACAGQWFPVAGPAAEPDAAAVVEIDLDTLRNRSPGAAAVIRVTHGQQQLHPGGFGYRSFVATAVFDCQHRTVTLTSAAFFSQASGQGVRLGAESSGREAGMPGSLLESVPLAARRALLRASCAMVPSY
jgi:hypothetical protein